MWIEDGFTSMYRGNIWACASALLSSPVNSNLLGAGGLLFYPLRMIRIKLALDVKNPREL